jgi:hypothetical protein
MNFKATSPGTDAGIGAAADDTNADTLDADLEAMRRAEALDDDDGGPASSDAAPTEGGKDKPADPARKAEDELKPELTVEELRERHRQKAAALREERVARQSRDARIAELEGRLARYEQGGQKPAAAAEGEADDDEGDFDLESFQIPDPRADPQGAFLAMSRVATALLEERRLSSRQTTEQQQQVEALQQLHQSFSAAEKEYAGVQPDYYDAVKHLREARLEELKFFGVTGPEAQRTFASEIVQLVNAAMRTQDHPAHIIFEMAKRRGFAGGQRQEANLQPVRAVQPAPDPAKAAADMKQRVDAGKLAKTLSGAGGKVTPNSLTVDAVNAIEDGDEFDRAFAELAKASKGR